MNSRFTYISPSPPVSLSRKKTSSPTRATTVWNCNGGARTLQVAGNLLPRADLFPQTVLFTYTIYLYRQYLFPADSFLFPQTVSPRRLYYIPQTVSSRRQYLPLDSIFPHAISHSISPQTVSSRRQYLFPIQTILFYRGQYLSPQPVLFTYTDSIFSPQTVIFPRRQCLPADYTISRRQNLPAYYVPQYPPADSIFPLTVSFPYTDITTSPQTVSFLPTRTIYLYVQ